MKQIILTLALALVAVAAQAKDIKTVVFTTTPQMHCMACENTIKNNLKYEKGVKKIETNVEQQKVTVTYDADKTTIEKIENAFKKFNYEARQVAADEQIKKDEHEGCSNM